MKRINKMIFIKSFFLLQIIFYTFSYSNGQSINNAVIIDRSNPKSILNRALNKSNPVGFIPGNFNVSSMGTATYSTPIELPLGPGGYKPALSVTYDSERGNDIMGVGWVLGGLSMISRTGRNVYNDGYSSGILFNDSKDRLLLDGRRLYEYGSNYETEDQSFATISRSGVAPNYSFQVIQKNGTRSVYGIDANSRLASLKGVVFNWLINKVYDANGNELCTYKYSKKCDTIYENQINLTEIDYGTNKITFEYLSRNKDYNLYYLQNFFQSHDNVLKAINIYSDSKKIGAYKFNYTDQLGFTCLYEMIQEDDAGNALNSTAFSWQGPDIKMDGSLFYNTSSYNPGNSTFQGDFNNDGFMDVMTVDKLHNIVFLNRGSKNGIIPDVEGTITPSCSLLEKYSSLISPACDICSKTTGETHLPLPVSLNTSGYLGVANYFAGDFDGDGGVDLAVVRELYKKGDDCALCLTNNAAGPNGVVDLLDLLNKDGLEVDKYEVTLYSFKGDDVNHIFEAVIPDKLLDIFLNNNHLSLDYNQDGKTDIFSANAIYSLQFGNPDLGTNDTIVKIGSSTQISKMKNALWIDYNNDGRVDFTDEHNNLYLWDEATKDFKIDSTFHLSDGWTIMGTIDYYNDGQKALLCGSYYNEHYQLGATIYNYFNDCPPNLMRKTNGKVLPIHGLDAMTNEFTNVLVADVNGDNRNDILIFNKDSLVGVAYLDENSAYGDDFIYKSMIEKVGGCTLVDFDGDGINEVVTTSGKVLKFANGLPGYRISGIIDGLNRKTLIDYSPLTGGSTIFSTTHPDKYPIKNFVEPLCVVSKISMSNGVDNTPNYQTYKYTDTKYHQLGRGFLGFGKITATDNFNNQAVRTFALDPAFSFPYLKTNETYMGGHLTSKTTYFVQTIPLYYAAGSFMHPYYSFLKQVDQTDTKDTTSTTYDYESSCGNLKSKTVTVNGTLAKETTTYSDFDVFGNPKTTTTLRHRKGESDITRTSTATYDPVNGRVLTLTSNHIQTTFTYDIFGNVLTKTIAAPGETERKTTYTYSGNRYLYSVENSLHQKAITVTDAVGNALSITDVNKLKTTYAYGAFFKLTETKTPDLHTLSQGMNWLAATGGDVPTGSLYYSRTATDGVFSGSEYFDSLGRSLRKVSCGFGNMKFYSDTKYNAKGQIIETCEPYPASIGTAKKITRYTYYADGKINTTDNAEVSIKYTYSTTDNTVKVTSTYKVTGTIVNKTIVTDGCGLTVSATDPGGTINYYYTAEGSPRQVTAPGNSTTITYNADGLQSELKDPNAGTMKYEYNGFGSINKQTDAKGNIISLTYDNLGRVKTKTVNGTVRTYTYDNANATGKLNSILFSDGKGTKYTYDSLYRLSSQTRTFDNESCGYQYSYNSKGLLSKLTYPSGFSISYTYNSSNDLTEVHNVNGNGLLWKVDNVNGYGQVTSYTLGNNKQATISYDASNRDTSLKVPGILDFSYKFNIEQQLKMRKELYYDTGSGTMKGFTESFLYDGINRLTSATKDNNTGSSAITYSSTVNNRISGKSDMGTYNYQPSNHQISTVSLSESLPSSQSITYNAIGKVATVADNDLGLGLSIKYADDDERYQCEFKEGTTRKLSRYYYNTYEKEILEDSSKRQLDYIYVGTRLVAIHEKTAVNDKMHYTYTDYLGSLRCITNASGVVEQQLSFDAWGNRRNAVTGAKLSNVEKDQVKTITCRGFTGHEHLDGFGLINMNGRMYDPTLGVFLSPDQYVQAPDNTQSYNRYAYCFNNPLMYTDATGWKTYPFRGDYFTQYEYEQALKEYYNEGGYWSEIESNGGSPFTDGLANVSITSMVDYMNMNGYLSYTQGNGFSRYNLPLNMDGENKSYVWVITHGTEPGWMVTQLGDGELQVKQFDQPVIMATKVYLPQGQEGYIASADATYIYRGIPGVPKGNSYDQEGGYWIFGNSHNGEPKAPTARYIYGSIDQSTVMNSKIEFVQKAVDFIWGVSDKTLIMYNNVLLQNHSIGDTVDAVYWHHCREDGAPYFQRSVITIDKTNNKDFNSVP